jgi:hypothetical protein
MSATHTCVSFSLKQTVPACRFEPSWAGWPAEEYRTLVVYKETQSTTKLDPEKDMWTGTWRDARPINPEGPQPENSLTGMYGHGLKSATHVSRTWLA